MNRKDAETQRRKEEGKGEEGEEWNNGIVE